MSELTQSLEKISFWMENSRSEHAQLIRNHPLHSQKGGEEWYRQPGLERELIELYVEEMNFNLPEELYQLYQWHNGKFVIGDYANPVWFDTFETGFNCVSKWGFPHFPVFLGDGCYYAIDAATEDLISPPIRLYEGYVSGGCEVLDTYAPNLTILMQAVAECVEKYDAMSIYLMNREPQEKYHERCTLISNTYKKHGIKSMVSGLWR